MLRRLASPRLAAWLIAVLILMTLLAVLLPQKSYMGAQFADFARDVPLLASLMGALSLDRVFWSWPIMVVATLLGVNVAACTFLRLRARRRPVRVGAPSTALSAQLSPGVSPTDFLETASGLLALRGYHVLTATDEGLAARAGGSGFWGSMLMHVSLLVIIAGGLATALTSFQGEIVITDGMTVVDSREAYSSVARQPRIGEPFSGTRVSVDSTRVGYERGVLVSAVAAMRAIEPSGRTLSKDVSVNHPLDAGGKSYLLRNSGYAPALVVGSPGGGSEEVVFSLADRTPLGWRDSTDLLAVDGSTVKLEILATPVPLADGQAMPAEEFAFSDPRLHVRLVRKGSPIWEGTLAQGQSVPAEIGVALTFEELRVWDSFIVRGDPTRWITYLGFWLAVVGSAWRFAVPERRISVAVRDVDGRSNAIASVRSRPWSGMSVASDAALLCEILSVASGEERPAGEVA